MLNLVISEDLIDWASSAAERRGMSVSALVREALERERERSREEALAEANLSADALEGVRAFAEKRRPEWVNR